MTDKQCSSCGGFCGRGGCKRENVKPEDYTKLVPDYNNSYICPKCKHQTPMYVKEWVGLTDEEIAEMHYEIKVKGMGTYKTEDIYRAIEAKLKEKNSFR